MDRSDRFLKVVMPITAAIVAGILLPVIYQLGWPDQASKADDPIGYWIGALLIPGVLVATYALGFAIAKRRERVAAGIPCSGPVEGMDGRAAAEPGAKLQTSAVSTGPIIIRVSRKRMWGLLIGALCFVGLGVLLVATGDAPLQGWVGIAAFGYFAIVFVQQLCDTRPRIIIDDRGISSPTSKLPVIEWTDIADVYVQRLRGNAFLCLKLRDPTNYTEGLSPKIQRAAALNRRLGLSDLNLTLTASDADPEQLHQLVSNELAARSS